MDLSCDGSSNFDRCDEELMTRPFNRTTYTDELSFYDQQHVLLLGLARAEFSTLNLHISADARSICDTIAHYHVHLLKNPSERDIGFSADLLGQLEDSLHID